MPNEEGMEQARKDYLDKVDERIAGAKVSQLAMAAPLESAGAPPTTTKPKTASQPNKVPEHKQRSNQKVGLVSALLAVGDLRPALSVLTKYPWMVDANTQLADLVLRILKHSITPLYESTYPPKNQVPGFSQPRTRYGAGGIQPSPPKKPLLTYWAPLPPSTSLVEFVFFYPEWVDWVPICSSFEHLADLLEPLMRFIGVHISRDPNFITKYLRLGRLQINTTVSFQACFYIDFVNFYYSNGWTLKQRS